MTNQQHYENDPDISNPQYSTVDGSEFEYNGIKAKMIHLATDVEGKPSGLPQYTGKSEMYFRGHKVGEALQAKVYKDRRMVLDFDWSHTHTNKVGGETFVEGTVHVQEYRVDESGNITRLSNKARLMNDAEIATYGTIIHHYNPRVKFR